MVIAFVVNIISCLIRYMEIKIRPLLVCVGGKTWSQIPNKRKEKKKRNGRFHYFVPLGLIESDTKDFEVNNNVWTQFSWKNWSVPSVQETKSNGTYDFINEIYIKNALLL